MMAAARRVLYIHGFNSSPDSRKAQDLCRYCQEHAPGVEVSVPALPHDPAAAMEQLETEVARNPPPGLLVGSSLGGYYATYLAEKHGLKAALVNPAVAPHRTLNREFLGRHTNMYTGEEYEITPAHVKALRGFETPVRHPEYFLLLVQTGDEVLDYHLAVEKYAGSSQIVQEGGDHAFADFEAVIPEILNFAGFRIVE